MRIYENIINIDPNILSLKEQQTDKPPALVEENPI